MKNLSDDHRYCLSQHELTQKLCSKMGSPAFYLTESQWKLRQQHNQNFPMEGKPLQKNTSIKRNK